MSLIWLNCLRQLKDDVEKDKKNMEKLKEIKDVTCFLYIYVLVQQFLVRNVSRFNNRYDFVYIIVLF